MTKYQLKLLHTLLHQYGEMRKFPVEKDEKEALVLEITQGRATSTKDLRYNEFREMVNLLEGYLSPLNEKMDRQRKKILYYAHQMRWETEDRKADMKRINAWCIKTGYLHKPLMKYKSQELTKLVAQFQQMYYAFLRTF